MNEVRRKMVDPASEIVLERKRIQLETALQHELELWNAQAQVLHGGHILEISHRLASAIMHPNSIVRS